MTRMGADDDFYEEDENVSDLLAHARSWVVADQIACHTCGRGAGQDSMGPNQSEDPAHPDVSPAHQSDRTVQVATGRSSCAPAVQFQRPGRRMAQNLESKKRNAIPVRGREWAFGPGQRWPEGATYAE